MVVAVTGIGVVSALGRGLDAHVQALKKNVPTFTPLSLFAAEAISARQVGQVDDALLDRLPHASRCQKLALASAADALEGNPVSRESGLICVGTTTGGIFETESHFLAVRRHETSDPALLRNHALGTVADAVAQHFELRGERQTFSTACSSSANAIGYAALRVERGEPWALAGGAESLCRTTFCGFHSLKLLAAGACRPFDATRDGLTLGEAAAFLLLEPVDAARARGAHVYGTVRGWGSTSDAHHVTSPHPEGDGALRAMQRCLAQAQLEASQLGYLNAHGTGTRANDAAESRAVLRLFGDSLPAVSSTKGLTGHTLGAAGALEAVISLLALENQTAWANTGLVEADRELKITPLVHAQPMETRYAMSTSFGFGGNNAALIFEGGTK